jgi:hypothetical protein
MDNGLRIERRLYATLDDTQRLSSSSSPHSARRRLSASDVLSTYRGVTGNWGVNGSWSNNPALGGFPNNGNGGVATYDAVINSGIVTLDQNIAIQKLDFNGARSTARSASRSTICSHGETDSSMTRDWRWRMEGC